MINHCWPENMITLSRQCCRMPSSAIKLLVIPRTRLGMGLGGRELLLLLLLLLMLLFQLLLLCPTVASAIVWVMELVAATGEMALLSPVVGRSRLRNILSHSRWRN